MLTISLERMADLLGKAQKVELSEPIAAEDAAETLEEACVIGEFPVDDPAYQALSSAVAALTPEEARDLLALAFLEQNSAELDEWQAMVEQAHEIPEEEVADQIVEILLLTNDIELALERLGYSVDDEDDAEDNIDGADAGEGGEPEAE
ncbi:MAG TPA: DUF3775 domain-containing protein [Stellaceae bacterium]|nr:DUF3775 domain-containing protein [Stellaceae bacterium]